MQVKKEFKELIPALTAEEFAQLEANCIAEGIRENILTWQGFIIDGHNRYEIALKHGLPFGTQEKYFKDENDVREWMILNQFGRRNLSSYQRSVLALQLESVFSAKAKEKKKEAGGAVRQKSDKPEIDTKKELAKVANVSHDTIAKVKKIEAIATPEVKAKLSTGEVSINQAYQEIKKEEKKAERKNIIEDQIQQIEQGKLPELHGLFDVVSVDPPWPYGREYDPDGSRVANPYPEMSIEEIMNLKIPFKPDSICFLWTTHAFLPNAFHILSHWGFEYKATMVWNKEKIGMGAWLRMQCEFVLLGIKGRPYWDNTTYRDIICEPRRQHSRKPDSFFDMVDKVTIGKKLEYFSREKRNNWEIYGNDTDKF
jgi:N6-adenosine-specific RNA methylase IME4